MLQVECCRLGARGQILDGFEYNCKSKIIYLIAIDKIVKIN